MFCVIGGDVFGESLEETLAVLGDPTEQTRPIALTGKIDARPRAARIPRGTRLDLHGYLGLIDAG